MTAGKAPFASCKVFDRRDVTLIYWESTRMLRLLWPGVKPSGVAQRNNYLFRSHVLNDEILVARKRGFVRSKAPPRPDWSMTEAMPESHLQALEQLLSAQTCGGEHCPSIIKHSKTFLYFLHSAAHRENSAQGPSPEKVHKGLLSPQAHSRDHIFVDWM